MARRCRFLHRCEFEVAHETRNAKSGHPRASGDPVNAEASDYWMPAFAGMTRGKGKHRNADQVRRVDGAEKSWPEIRIYRSRGDAVRLWHWNGRGPDGRERTGLRQRGRRHASRAEG